MSKELNIKDITRKNDDNTYIETKDEQPVSDQISLLAIQELLNKKNLKSISRVKFDQVSILTKLHLFAQTFGIAFTNDLAELVEELQISVSGLGRKELVQLVQRRDGLMEQFLLNQKDKSSKDVFR